MSYSSHSTERSVSYQQDIFQLDKIAKRRAIVLFQELRNNLMNQFPYLDDIEIESAFKDSFHDFFNQSNVYDYRFESLSQRTFINFAKRKGQSRPQYSSSGQKRVDNSKLKHSVQFHVIFDSNSQSNIGRQQGPKVVEGELIRQAYLSLQQSRMPDKIRLQQALRGGMIKIAYKYKVFQ